MQYYEKSEHVWHRRTSHWIRSMVHSAISSSVWNEETNFSKRAEIRGLVSACEVYLHFTTMIKTLESGKTAHQSVSEARRCSRTFSCLLSSLFSISIAMTQHSHLWHWNGKTANEAHLSLYTHAAMLIMAQSVLCDWLARLVSHTYLQYPIRMASQ